MIPNILSGQGSSIFFFIVIVVFRKRLRNKWILWMVEYFISPTLVGFTIQLLYQFTIDASICSLLQFKAYSEVGVLEFLQFSRVEYLNLILSILFMSGCVGICFYGIRKVQITEDLSNKVFLREHSVFVDGLRVDSKLSAQHTNITIVRKILIAVVLIFVADGCIQTCILMLMIVFTVMLIVHSKPYED